MQNDVDTALIESLLFTGWKLTAERNALEKTYTFKDFVSAIAFMAKVAHEAEALNHHPDWSNHFRRVHVRLTTHDIGGLSPFDIELATRMDRIATFQNAP